MKKIIILFVIAFVSGMNFTSCTSEEVSPSSSSTIVGKWNYSKLSYTINGVTSPEIEYDENEPGCSKNYIEFKTGGVFNKGEYSGSTCVLDSESGTWTQSGNTITFSDGTDVYTAQIVSITSTELKVKLIETDSGIGLTMTVNSTLIKA